MGKHDNDWIKCLNCGWQGLRSECPHDAWGNGSFSCECPTCKRSIPDAFIPAIAKASEQQ